MTRFIIQDWAGNELTDFGTFKSFDDAWEFLLSKFDNDEDLGEFYAIETETN